MRFNKNESWTFGPKTIVSKDGTTKKIGNLNERFCYNDKQIPGPDKYNYKYLGKNYPKYSIPKSKLDNKQDIDERNYNQKRLYDDAYNSNKNKISALSKAARFKPILENENNKLPPVGHYNTNKYTMFNTNSKNKGITIPKASLNNSKNIYTEENMYYYDKDNIAFKINNKYANRVIPKPTKTRKKDDLFNVMPGPGSYQPIIIKNKKTFNSTTFNKSNISSKSSNNLEKFPGPASYNIPCSIRDVIKHERARGNFDERYTFIK